MTTHKDIPVQLADAVWLTMPADGVKASIAFEFPPGCTPKRFARLFLGREDVDWGWVVHESAVEVWRR